MRNLPAHRPRSYLVIVACLITILSNKTLYADGADVVKVDFERHIVGLLGKLGCNTGSCHGSFQGKGGLFLSLFSYAPEKDYKSLVRDAFGRRVNTTDPDQSLILLKATGVVAHGGGQRVKPGSRQYEMIRNWIADGAKWEAGTGRIVRLNLSPPSLELSQNHLEKLKVSAEFADGSKQDVTSLTDFKAQDDSVLSVTPEGEVSARQPGDSAVIANYLGQVISGRFYQPWPKPETTPDSSLATSSHPIDQRIEARLNELNLVRSGQSTDGEFLRRITLDTIGRQPTPDEIEKFSADQSPTKRDQKVDELLAHPMHSAVWATKLSDWTLNSLESMENRQDTYRNLRPKWAKMWWDWLRTRFASNEPYDKIIKGLLTATSRDQKTPEQWLTDWLALSESASKSFNADYASKPTNDLFWRRQGFTKEQSIELIASSFLGLQIQCAQCHKHPFDRWTQADYRSFQNIVVPVKFDGNAAESRKILKAEADGRRAKETDELKQRQIQPHREVYVDQGRGNYLRHPDNAMPLPVKPPGGPEFMAASRQMASKDFRGELVDWMTKPENPYFAANFVNRVWAHYFGIGIINPVDNFAVGNPASNSELLKALADKFIELKFDIRAFERFVLTTQAYSRSSLPSANNANDRLHFARYVPHPLMAEVAADVVADAIGWRPDPRTMADVPPGTRAIEVPGNQINQRDLAFQFRIFGRPARSVSCECERAAEPALPQSLFLAGDDMVIRGIEQGPWADWARDYEWPDEKLIEQAFLRTLARLPNSKELVAARERISGKSGEARMEGLCDVIWALVNTREFLLNH